MLPCADDLVGSCKFIDNAMHLGEKGIGRHLQFFVFANATRRFLIWVWFCEVNISSTARQTPTEVSILCT
jgi:hypothetical protein